MVLLEVGVWTRTLTCKDGTLNQLHQFVHLCKEVHGDLQVPTGWAVKESLTIGNVFAQGVAKDGPQSLGSEFHVSLPET